MKEVYEKIKNKINSGNITIDYLEELFATYSLSNEEKKEVLKYLKENYNLNGRIIKSKKKANYINQYYVYVKEIKKFPILSSKEQEMLAIKAQKGDIDARKKLVESNLQLVVSIAKNYKCIGLSDLDLIEYGNMGLMASIDKFNPEKGASFSTYASYWIRQRISRSIIKYGKSMSYTYEIMRNCYRFLKVEEMLWMENFSEDIPNTEIANKMNELYPDINVTSSDVMNYRNYLKEIISINMPLAISQNERDQDGYTYYDLESSLIDDYDIEDQVFNNIQVDTVYDILTGKIKSNLTRKEKKCLLLLFGFDNNGIDMNDKEVAYEMKISRTWSNKLKLNALEKIKKLDEIKKLKKDL